MVFDRWAELMVNGRLEEGMDGGVEVVEVGEAMDGGRGCILTCRHIIPV